MSVNIKIKGIDQAEKKFNKLYDLLNDNEKLLENVGPFLNFQILQRTAKGVDYEGKQFKPYSEGYKKRRKKAGRPVNKVDLNFTGSMLSAITQDNIPNGLSLFFLNTKDKFGTSNPDKAFWNQQDRKFFAVSAKDILAVEKIILDEINGVING
jgi:hypothetical protein